MTDDIVERLRFNSQEYGFGWLENAADEITRLREALRVAAHELELLYFFAISNGIAEAGVPPHVAARAALEGK